VDISQCRMSLHIVVHDAGQERRGCKNLKTHDPLCSLCYRFAVMTHLNNVSPIAIGNFPSGLY
jgi:hypothetical protein